MICPACDIAMEEINAVEQILLGKARKPSILTPTGLLLSILGTSGKLGRLVRVSVSRIRDRVRQITSRDFQRLPPDSQERAIKQLSSLIEGLPEQFKPAVVDALAAETDRVIKKTNRALAGSRKTLPLIPTLVTEHAPIVRALATTSSLFFSAEYQRKAQSFQNRARRVIATGISESQSASQISAALSQEFSEAAINQSYWDTVASVHTARARSFASVATYSRAGVEAYRWVSVLDDNTTDICWSLNGLVFSVGAAMEQIARYEQADSMEQVKEATPFAGSKQGSVSLPSGTQFATVDRSGQTPVVNRTADGQTIQQGGISLPPAHYRCRSTVVPIF